MQGLEECDVKKRVEAEIRWCFTYEDDRRRECAGASGRKLRQVCIYCPNYRRGEGENEKNN